MRNIILTVSVLMAMGAGAATLYRGGSSCGTVWSTPTAWFTDAARTSCANAAPTASDTAVIVDSGVDLLAGDTAGAIRLAGGALSASSLPCALSFVGAGGVLKTESDPSARLADSTAAIVFDDNDVQDNAWQTALAASNVGGLEKRGAKTLTLRAVPQYAGPTRVAAGGLVVPAGTVLGDVTVAPGATLTVDATGAAEGALLFSAAASSDADLAGTVAFANLPDGASVTVVRYTTGGFAAILGAARTFTWCGADAEAAWHDAANWKIDGEPAGSVPGAADTAVFESGAAFRLTASAQVLKMVVTGGDFAFDGDVDFRVLGTLSVAGGKVKIGGTATLDVGALAAADAAVLAARAADKALVATCAARAWTERLRLRVAATGIALTGAGAYEMPAGEQVFAVGVGTTNEICGPVTGPANIVKRGAGTMRLAGLNAFTGDVAIEEGTLALGCCDYADLINYDIDLANTNGWTLQGAYAATLVNEKYPNAWTLYAQAFLETGTPTGRVVTTEDFFGGRPALRMTRKSGTSQSARYALRKPGGAYVDTVSQATIAAIQNNMEWYDSRKPGETLNKNGDMFLCYDNGESSATGRATWWNGVRVNQDSAKNLVWEARAKDADLGWALFLDGATDLSYRKGEATVLSLMAAYEVEWDDSRLRGCDQFGFNFGGAVAEIIGFRDPISLEVRQSVETYLKLKWGTREVTGSRFLPETAKVTMKAGATLDLGGVDQTCASFAGAGTIANGALATADGTLVQSGGALAASVADGMTYVASKAGETLVLTGGAGKKVTIRVPATWFAAGASGTRAIYCDCAKDDITWVIGKSGVTPLTAGDGWYSLGEGGFSVRVR